MTDIRFVGVVISPGAIRCQLDGERRGRGDVSDGPF